MPHLATKDFAKRVVTIITSATVAKAKLNPISEYSAWPMSTRGAVEKKTKKVPIPALKPTV
ncbi:Uncharacterised protein [Vibrio cholerae]|nr:Uncharacterised protein [Vibrio cholerae]